MAAARSIPARAGNTGRNARHSFCFFGPSPLARGTRHGSRRCSSLRTVHPRSRGEHAAGLHAAGDVARSIPARAGNTSRCAASSAAGSVHPRSRGEHGRRRQPNAQRERSIPARAGNTSCFTARWKTFFGPSPLARGTHLRELAHDLGVRSIPARAGNTVVGAGTLASGSGPSPLARGTRPALAGTFGAGAVHPRSRGEHQPRPRRSNRLHRSIPARAGNTAAQAPSS